MAEKITSEMCSRMIFLDIKQAAEFYGFGNAKTIHCLLAKNALPFIKFGDKAIRIPVWADEYYDFCKTKMPKKVKIPNTRKKIEEEEQEGD